VAACREPVAVMLLGGGPAGPSSGEAVLAGRRLRSRVPPPQKAVNLNRT